MNSIAIVTLAVLAPLAPARADFPAPPTLFVATSDRGSLAPAGIAAATVQPAAAGMEEPEPMMTAGHNGSDMELTDTKIIYSRPKPSIRDVVKPGTVLVEGRWIGERFEGTAYAFKKGCSPAPYPVKGGKVERPGGLDLVLRGAGPVRQGCDVVGYSDRSPHARLVFDQIMSN